MSSYDIPMCAYHLDRRGFSHDLWKVPTENDPCHQCTTGMMPEWEFPNDLTPPDVAYEDHVARLLEKAEHYERNYRQAF